jgi:NAD(P)-dependent dehydrogenase (short-subunit alcohol dehydrogenase family)
VGEVLPIDATMPRVHMERTPLPVERLALASDTFAGQVTLVTGAGRGIGLEVARAFARLGAQVVIAELNEDTGRATASLIRCEGGQALFIKTEVSIESEVAALVHQARHVFGPIDILVNNAIVCPVVSIVEMDTALWDQVIAVNLRAAFLTCRACLPDMIARRHGSIVNMVSTDAMPGLAAYIASKQGLAGFSQSLAAEVGSTGIRVVAFGPGMVDTPAIRSVATNLAPQLGLTEDRFLSLSIHPAFDGLMPAEYSGAAAAYLVARLADEYHGEVVNAYTVLERAGLIDPPASAPRSMEPTLPVSGVPIKRAGTSDRARELAEQLQTIILYRLRPGRLFGHWFMLLTHLGGVHLLSSPRRSLP